MMGRVLDVTYLKRKNVIVDKQNEKQIVTMEHLFAVMKKLMMNLKFGLAFSHVKTLATDCWNVGIILAQKDVIRLLVR